jgi:hypothetical protein
MHFAILLALWVNSVVADPVRDHKPTPFDGIVSKNVEEVSALRIEGIGSDLTKWKAMGTISSGTVMADGGVVFTGTFTTYDGEPCVPHVFSIGEIGDMDKTFSPLRLGQENIYAYDTDSDDNLLLAGAIVDQPHNKARTPDAHLYLLSEKGVPNVAFTAAAAATVLGPVVAVRFQSGKILVVQKFENEGRIDRLERNGALDATFQPIRINNGDIPFIVQSDGKIIVGGAVLQRFGRDGQPDPSFPKRNAKGTFAQLKLLPGQKFISVDTTQEPIDKRHGMIGVTLGRFFISRMSRNGSEEKQYELETGNRGSILPLAIDKQQRMYVGGYHYVNTHGWKRGLAIEVTRHERYLERLDAEGRPDSSFIYILGDEQEEDDLQLETIGLDAQDRLLLGMYRSKQMQAPMVIRLKREGSVDRAFSWNADCKAPIVFPPIIVALKNRTLLVPNFYFAFHIADLARFDSHGILDDAFMRKVGNKMIGTIESIEKGDQTGFRIRGDFSLFKPGKWEKVKEAFVPYVGEITKGSGQNYSPASTVAAQPRIEIAAPNGFFYESGKFTERKYRLARRTAKRKEVDYFFPE